MSRAALWPLAATLSEPVREGNQAEAHGQKA